MDDEKSKGAIKNFGWDTVKYVPYRIFPVLFGFLGLWIYTRIFAPEDYGDYMLINITISLLSIFAYTWIDEANLRFFSAYKKENRLDVYVSTGFFLLTGTLIILVIVLLALSYLSILPKALSFYMSLVIGDLVVVSLFEILLTLIRANRKAVEASLYRSLSSFLYLAISITLIFLFNLGIAAILLGFIITNTVLSLAIIMKYDYVQYFHIKSFSTETMKEYAHYGIPLTITQIFSWILLLSDRYFIEFFKGSYQVGIYSAAFQLADYPISMVTSIVLMAAWPIIIDTWEKSGEKATKSLITGLSRYYIIFVVPAFIGVTLLSQNMIGILTPEYYIGYTIIPMVCLAKALFGLCWFMNIGLELKKKTSILAILIGVSGLIEISLNFMVVPTYGFIGSSIALATSYLIYWLLSAIISRKYLAWDLPISSIKNVVLSTCAMAVVLYVVKSYLDLSILSLIMLIALGVLVYLFAMLLTREVWHEAKWAKKIVSSVVLMVFPRLTKKISFMLTGIVER